MLSAINFTDPQFQKCYDCNFAELADRSPELSQIGALIATHDLFRLVEGSHSLGVHEAIHHLLHPSVRPTLRSWYQLLGKHLNPEEIAFRNHLSHLAGESL
jgi:hypothetical protein